MKITQLGVILACKNVGLWLTSYTVSGIKADPQSFCLALMIYGLISVPSDLFLMNKAEEKGTNASGSTVTDENKGSS